MRLVFVSVIIAVFTAACNLTTQSTTTPAPLIEDTAINPDGWIPIASGIEYREFDVDPSYAFPFVMSVVRIDSAQVDFRVHYQPDNPLSSLEWQAHLSDAAVFVNGNFFTGEFEATGLVVSDGVASGTSYSGYGGMFQVDQNGAVRVRSLVEGGSFGEPLQHAVQAFPLLVDYGGQRASTGPGFNDPSRRTMIAQDFSGRILLFSTGLLGEISFNDAQEWLLNSGLDIDIAFNLDGGKSTTLMIRPDNGTAQLIPAVTDLPVILAVYPKQ
ncbi:MAG: phosphodiester glycosidase family protein [Chloroflexi bacterium]|nr:phosphodiester glycosidase family protein [Chloroflexota bacterium]